MFLLLELEVSKGMPVFCVVAIKFLQCSRLNTKKQQDQSLWSTEQKVFVIWPLTECVSRPLT